MDCFKNLAERRDEFESEMLIIAGKIVEGGTVYWRVSDPFWLEFII